MQSHHPNAHRRPAEGHAAKYPEGPSSVSRRGMVDEMKLNAHFAQDEDGMWNAEHSENKKSAAFTYGSTLRQCKARMTEALALHYDIDESEVDLVMSVEYDGETPHLKDLLASISVVKQRQEEATAEWARLRNQTSHALAASGMSVRDIAAILGVSPGRVQQLLKEDEQLAG